MRLRQERAFGALCALILACVLLFGFVESASSTTVRGQAAPALPYAAVASGPAAFASEAQIVRAVRDGLATSVLPANAQPTIQQLAAREEYGNSEAVGCPGLPIGVGTLSLAACTFGDRTASRVMVLEGDSRAQMWFDSVDTIATAEHYRLVFLAKGGCPSAVATLSIFDGKVENAPWPACSEWHRFVVQAMREVHPEVVITTSQPHLYLTGSTTAAPPSTVEADFLAFYRQVPKSARLVVIGNFPEPITGNPSLCLSRQPPDIQTCTWKPTREIDAVNAAVRAAAATAHARFIDEGKWLCVAGRCPAVIDDLIPYTIDGYHLDRPYAEALTGVLWQKLTPVLQP